MREQLSIFRYEATCLETPGHDVRRYSQVQKKAIFLRVVRPVTLLSMWIALTILLGAAGCVGWYAGLH
jgi:hypothetical protein